jgi:hypothetical protein
MQGDDGNLYVVKFQGNPQGTSILINEILAAEIGTMLGLPVPAAVVVELPAALSRTLHFETPDGRDPVLSGLHFGSRLVVTHIHGRTYDCLPQRCWNLIRNPDALVGIELFDLWVCNRDTRQMVFWRLSQEKKLQVSFIDNGHCFGGPEWKFADLGLPVSAPADPVHRATWQEWADRIATFPIRRLANFSERIPTEWCSEKHRFELIYETLTTRQLTFKST